jgi:signal transduction histidine kinase
MAAGERDPASSPTTHDRRTGPASARSGRRLVALQVGQFALAGLVALAIVGIATSIASRRVGEREAISDARSTTVIRAQAVVTPALTDALLDGDRAALDAVDDVVRRSVLDESLVRVKLWTADGTIAYSDEASLVGTRWELGSEERSAMSTGRIEAEVSDLGEPENRFERQYDKLLEVYLPVRTPGGEVLLFEAYYRYDLVTSNGARLWRSFAPLALGALILLELVQVPLAWSLARRLRQRGEEREALLLRSLEASDVERRQIASDLHDSVVQDLTGVALELSAAGRRDPDPQGDRVVIDSSAESIRGSIKALRSLLVDIYPPDFDQVSLDSAVSDLLVRAQDQGVAATLDSSALRDPIPDATARLLYRAAQEGVRNALAHGHPSRVSVTLGQGPGVATVEVLDDGRGLDEARLAQRQAAGHVGLVALRGLLLDAGGSLVVEAAPGGGTRLWATVPVR